jgi:hypothetical protein
MSIVPVPAFHDDSCVDAFSLQTRSGGYLGGLLARQAGKTPGELRFLGKKDRPMGWTFLALAAAIQHCNGQYL